MTCLARRSFVTFLVLGFVELLGSVGLWLLLYLGNCGHYFFKDVSVCLSIFSPLGTSVTHILALRRPVTQCCAVLFIFLFAFHFVRFLLLSLQVPLTFSSVTSTLLLL